MLSKNNCNKLKTNLRLAIHRLKLVAKKKTELAQKSRKEIADFLSQDKVERARIRVEHIIREDYLVEALEIVEMYCDTLLARFGMIEHLQLLEDGLAMAVSSILWASPRLEAEVKELKVISNLLTAKYGARYTSMVRENPALTSSVDKSLMQKLDIQVPSKALVEHYLIQIAQAHGVLFKPDVEIISEDERYRTVNNKPSAQLDIPQSSSMPQIEGNTLAATGFNAPFQLPQPGFILPNLPPPPPQSTPLAKLTSESTPSVNNTNKPDTRLLDLDETIFPPVPNSSEESPQSPDVPQENDSFDEMLRRFAALKKRK